MWIRKINDEILVLLNKMNYKAVVVEEISTDEPFLKNNILIVKKIVIETSSRSELRNKLKNIKKKKNIVSVKPKSIEAARMAAHDTRVDTIIIDSDTVDFLDKQQYNLMKQYNKPLEIPLSVFREQLDFSLKSMIYRRVKYYLYYTKQPLIVSSRASDWDELMIPKSTSVFISQLLGIDRKKVLSFLTTYAREILVYNGVVV